MGALRADFPIFIDLRQKKNLSSNTLLIPETERWFVVELKHWKIICKILYSEAE